MQVARHHAGAGAGARRADLRPRPALDPAPGPRHRPRRRGPRPGDRRAGPAGLAHRPPRPHDPAHQRRRRRRHPPGRHGRRAVPRRVVAVARRRPAPGAPAVRGLRRAVRPVRPHAGAARASAPPSSRAPRRCAARAAPSAAASATAAASASTRCCPSPPRCARCCCRRPTEEAIGAAARANGMLTLRASALAAAHRGATTYEEVLRATTVDSVSGPQCPSCARALADDMLCCPYDGTPLGSDRCAGCDKPLDAEWRTCPWCRTPPRSRRRRRRSALQISDVTQEVWPGAQHLARARRRPLPRLLVVSADPAVRAVGRAARPGRGARASAAPTRRSC